MSYKNEINQYCVNHGKEGIKDTLIYKAETNSYLIGRSEADIEFMSLTEMFNWEESREGFHYWNNVYNG